MEGPQPSKLFVEVRIFLGAQVSLPLLRVVKKWLIKGLVAQRQSRVLLTLRSGFRNSPFPLVNIVGCVEKVSRQSHKLKFWVRLPTPQPKT